MSSRGSPSAKRTGSPRAPSPPAKRHQPAPLDIAAIRAQLAAKKAALQNTAAPAAPGPASLPPKPPAHADVAHKLAAAKARIEALNARAANPYLSGASPPSPSTPCSWAAMPSSPPPRQTGTKSAPCVTATGRWRPSLPL
ncbi:U4/U6 small nuclear ribonucleoprotein PRP3 [Cryptococcus neoformans Tu259-1]|uniref:U4/U6 small nuclear ribonucleoprotein PRP3 n=1 Tax=Cryptococcus neoformans Tu259-1 TaxID=1230072 RepID=A0A854QFG6_CRYNE|nr:U4/U6 small nuclear ribonucleoprotein PRP3 [Cryptococcus neoformans var. grubii Tu259-1]